MKTDHSEIVNYLAEGPRTTKEVQSTFHFNDSYSTNKVLRQLQAEHKIACLGTLDVPGAPYLWGSPLKQEDAA